MELVLELFLIHCVCFILLLLHEYTVLVIESRKLCKLLRQRAYDAKYVTSVKLAANASNEFCAPLNTP